MEETFFDRIVGILSNQFELLVYINGCLLALYLAVFIALKFRDAAVREFFHSTLRGVLYMVIIVGQVVLFALFGYLYWKNYRRPAPELQLSRDVLASTRWVKSDVRVYFIDNNALRSIRVDGRDSEDVFLADAPVKEYHFSPDGAHLLVLTQNDLFLLNRKTKEHRRVDALKEPVAQGGTGATEGVRGSISGIRWAPDSRKFVYEVARWSEFAAQDNVYIYTLGDHTKRSVKSPTRRISSLYWGQEGDGLYYLRHEARDPSLHSSAFDVKVFRIPLATLTPELVAEIPFEKSSVPIENLKLRGIHLFLGGDRLSFGRPGGEDWLVSPEGASVGIDEDDYLYFVSKRWFRRRLFKIPRETGAADVPRHQYKGGDLAVRHIRWIPGGRYVIMEHKYWGVLILEPSTGRVGLLVRANGHTFGWYRGLKI